MDTYMALDQQASSCTLGVLGPGGRYCMVVRCGGAVSGNGDSLTTPLFYRIPRCPTTPPSPHKVLQFNDLLVSPLPLWEASTSAYLCRY